MGLVVENIEKFSDNLTRSRKADYWKKASSEESSKLSYLTDYSKNARIPKSPEKILKENTYPFDKLQKIDAENRANIIKSAINGNIQHKALQLIGKQSLVRKMVSTEKENNNLSEQSLQEKSYPLLYPN
ncbi:hypothetical protein TPSD3_11505 [Thioflexithrix psekupsensis]|uniref:Uncharacterized protein n=2 Tax=Thioflexithrix psekupsensis TaxID=1570016 RepID=A0A251X709_9GAMM|nr:hypothetical protein TPSD3_11505 [Thioflexithrix psekupsensis]